MVKRKVVIKPVPPDVSALKLLVEIDDDKDISNLTDEELEKEKLRLIETLIKNKVEIKNKKGENL